MQARLFARSFIFRQANSCSIALLLLLLVAASMLSCRRSSNKEDLPVLTAVKQIRDLSQEEAERSYRVRIRGICTYQHDNSKTLIIQDPTGGIPVDSSQIEGSVAIGQETEVLGFTGRGEAAMNTRVIETRRGARCRPGKGRPGRDRPVRSRARLAEAADRRA